MRLVPPLVLAIAFVATAACKKKDQAAPNEPGPGSGSEVAGSAAAGAGAPGSAAPAAGSAVTPDASADFIAVYAPHAQPKPEDPVEIKFEKFAVTKAAFDPNNLEGGTATVELDLASISSGSEKRDGHLKSADYIDLAKFTTATIDVANVKKQGDKTYSADAKVTFRDEEKTYPVTFEVIEATGDHVRIRGAQKFARADFKLGKAPGDPDESVAPELEIKLQLTLKKT